MPDYNPNAGVGEGPVRRPVRAPPARRRYGPGGLPTEGVEPAPKPWPIAPWIALILMIGFLALQMYPETHFRHPRDPSRTWVPIKRNEGVIDHEATWEHARQIWFGAESKGSDTGEGTDGAVDSQGITTGQGNPRGQSTRDVQIFLSTDENDLRALAVVINSTIVHARYPERIKFNLVIPASGKGIEYYKLKAFFPAASINIFTEPIDFEGIEKLISYRKDSKARKELSTPYNFLLYYLPALLKDQDIDKIIYLDTDVVVQGDIEELYRKGLEGYSVAAVKDCSQHFEIYFDFEQLNEIQEREGDSKPWLPKKPFDPEECVFNRGTLVIDVKKWIEQNVTEAIEWWLMESSRTKKPLFKYGLSQPPFLLALYNKYKILGHEWNVRGLGRDKFSDKEMDFYEGTYGQRPEKKPFKSFESDYAKILHFNGEFKPWKRGRVRLPNEDVVSLCGDEGDECYRLWWQYLDKSAEAELKST